MELRMIIQLVNDKNCPSDDSSKFSMIVQQSETIAPTISFKALNGLLDQLLWFTKFYFAKRIHNELIRIANQSSKKKGGSK